LANDVKELEFLVCFWLEIFLNSTGSLWSARFGRGCPVLKNSCKPWLLDFNRWTYPYDIADQAFIVPLTTCLFQGVKFMAKRKAEYDVIEPIGPRVLVLKDEPKRETKGGIALPDAAEIPTITGRIVTISRVVEHDEDMPLRQYDKILFHPKNAIPVDFETGNQLFVVPVEDIVAVFRRSEDVKKDE
jgi:chaperonin GroES